MALWEMEPGDELSKPLLLHPSPISALLIRWSCGLPVPEVWGSAIYVKVKSSSQSPWSRKERSTLSGCHTYFIHCNDS